MTLEDLLNTYARRFRDWPVNKEMPVPLDFFCGKWSLTGSNLRLWCFVLFIPRDRRPAAAFNVPAATHVGILHVAPGLPVESRNPS